TEFKNAWQTFYAGTKQWAYTEDQLVTTHPIFNTVKNTDEAFASFDGITYGKGASVMKQASHFVGPKNFRDGVRTYFKTHEYKNTRLKDFVSALAKAANVSLDQWTELWLNSAGLNQIQADFQCDGGKVT